MAETNFPNDPILKPRKGGRNQKAAIASETKEVAPVDTIPSATPTVPPNKSKWIWSFIKTNSPVLDLFVNTLTFLIVACFGSWLLFKQNGLFENQNALIKQQMSLDEASRRGALVMLMSNIMDKVDEEIKEQKSELRGKGISKSAVDTMKFSLSQSLIGQIAALSHSFKPYRYMEGDTLIERPLSPERGQLLMTLTLLPLDTFTLQRIYKSATFESAALQWANLRGAHLVRAPLKCADLQGSDLQGACLRSAYLLNSDLSSADLRSADLRSAHLMDANLIDANLINANLRGAMIFEANLRGASLQGADLRGAYLNPSKLKVVKSLFLTKGTESIKIDLLKTHPQLFEGDTCLFDWMLKPEE